MNSEPLKCLSSLISPVKRYAFPSAILCLLLSALPFSTLAQEATVLGTVTDPSDALVPGAKITLTNVETGLSQSITTNQDGQYVVSNLHIGHYDITADAKGFKVAERKGIVLNVGDRTRIDFHLQMSGAAESVTVESDAVRVQTETGEVSNVITGKQVTQLATNGRSLYTLVNLAPGTSSLQGDFQTPTTIAGDAGVSVNGGRPIHTLYMIDGGEDNDRGGGGFDVLPSLDSLAEFRMMTSNYSAEYGLSTAGTIHSVIKSGTKQFHAAAWEFVRNDALNARGFFFPAPNKIQKLRFNTYGFNAGGQVPVWKSHPTFFFYNMEWRDLITGGSLNQVFPSTATYGGNFSSLFGAGATSALHVPNFANLSPALQAKFAADGLVSGGSFPGNVIPANLLDSNAQALLKAGIFPAPTTVDSKGNPTFIGGNNARSTVREEIARVDHQFTDKFSVFGHWISEQISQGFGTTQWSGDNSPAVGDTMGNPSYSAVVHTTYTIRPNLLNEASFNYNGNRINIVPKGLISAPSGFNFNRLFTGPNPLNRIPSIALSNGLGAAGNYTSNWTPWTNTADDYQIRDDISWTKGTHQFKFGGSWALFKKRQDIFASTQGSFTFNGFYTGNGFADYLLGFANSYNEAGVKDSGQWNNVSWAAYVQDDWRATRRLTLNLGLRWDGVPHTYEANHRMSNFYPNLYNPANAALLNPGGGSINPASPGLGTSPNPILAGVPFYLNGIGIDGLNGVPKGLVDNHWAAFGPRFGFAYDLTGKGKTVLRGGAALTYERIQGNDVYNGGTNVPFSATVGLSNVFLANPQVSVATGNPPARTIPVVSISGIDRKNYKLPVTYQYSLGLQQALGSKSVLSLSYVGNQSRHENDYRETNLPPFANLPALVTSGGSGYNTQLPFLGFRSLRLAENEANGNYNSLQVDLRANVKNDLTVQFGYTYSHAFDVTNTSGTTGFDLANVSNPYAGWKFDYGPSPFDRRHVAFTNFVYQIPFLKNSGNRLLKTSLGGWEVSGIVTMQTGSPINVTQGGTNVDSVIPNLTNLLRPNVTGPITYPHSVTQWFNTSVFSAAPAGTYGNLSYNALRGPGRDNWNIALFKSFVLSSERGSRIEFRAESFNTWNHTQFKGSEGQGAGGGGITTSTTDGRFGQVTAAYDPRVFQLGLKVYF